MTRSAALTLALAATLLTGHIVDQTTGQPLPGVTVHLTGAHTALTLRTNAEGMFRARVPAGRYALLVQSRDVPPQHFAVTARGARTTVTEQACSTTLDYSCDAALPEMNAGG